MADRIVTEMVPVLGALLTEKSKNTALEDFAFASPDKHFTHVTKIWSDEEMKKCNGNFGPPLVVAAGQVISLWAAAALRMLASRNRNNPTQSVESVIP